MKEILSFILATALTHSMSADEVLIGYGPDAYPLDKIETVDSSISLSPEGKLIAEFGDSTDWPGISFEGPWDLSHANYLNVN